MGDAIIRTLVRLFITHRHLLEWTTAASRRPARAWILAASIGRWRAASCSAWRWRGGAIAAVASRPGRSPCRSHCCGWRRRRSRSGSAGRRTRRAAALAIGAGCTRSAPDRAAHLALLRNLRDAGRQHAAARQFPGGPETGRRASDVADQHRPLPAVGRRRARLRLGGQHRRPSSGWRRLRLHAEAAALQRPFLQLVRRRRTLRAARPGLCLLRRQRQSRRPPDRPGQCLRGVDGRVLRRRDARRGHGRQSRPGARGSRRAARRATAAAGRSLASILDGDRCPAASGADARVALADVEAAGRQGRAMARTTCCPRPDAEGAPDLVFWIEALGARRRRTRPRPARHRRSAAASRRAG